MINRKIKPHQIIVIIILILFLIVTVSTIHLKSPSYDEPGHLAKGFIFQKTGDILIVTHPPLMHIISAFPLLFINIQLPNNYTDYLMRNDLSIGQEIFFGANNNANIVFFWSRLPNVLLAVLLGFYVYKWAKELYGIIAGIFALLLYTFNPIIIGNAPLIMTDMTITCFGFITFYYLWRFLSDRSIIDLILTGITFGLAQVSKFSALFLIPIYILFMMLSAYDYSFRILFKETINKTRLKKLASLGTSLGIIILLTLLIINIVYAFDGFLKPLNERLRDDPSPYYDKEYFKPDAIAGRLIDNPPLRYVISNSLNYASSVLPYGYIKEVISVIRIKNSSLENSATGVYIMGKFSKEGFWYYSLFAFLIKSPIPLLILILISFVFIIHFKIDFKNEVFLILPILVFFVFFSLYKSSGGIRYILPTFPFIFVFIGRIFSNNVMNANKVNFRKLFTLLIILLMVWYIAESFFIFPNYTAYFNQLIGGSSNGYKYLQSTDFDAGQDLPMLAKYINKRGISNLKFAYGGGSTDPFYYLNFTCISCLGCPSWVLSKCPENCSPMSGIIAISATLIQYADLRNMTCFEWIKEYDPIEKVGHTIFVYNITEDTNN